jgi:hypothetical protein
MGKCYPCATIKEAVESMPTVKELDAFADALRNPLVPGSTKVPTEDDWHLIAHRRVELLNKEAKA